MSTSLRTTTRPVRQQEGITSIAVRGFKSLAEECAIEVRPLTLLAGANSSGKSSIMQPLLMMKQTLEATYDPGPLLLDGPNVRFTDTEQLLSKLQGGPRASELEIGVETDGKQSIQVMFARRPGSALELVQTAYHRLGHQAVLRPAMSDEEIEAALPVPFGSLIKALEDRGKQATRVRWRIVRSRCLLKFGLVRVLGGGDGDASFPIDPLMGDPEPAIRGVIHLPGLRGNPERAYKVTSVGPGFPGVFQEYTASLINHWATTRDDRMNDLGAALSDLGLTWKVETKRADDTRIEVRVGRLPACARGGARDMVNIADVGFGVSQTLPVLVALLAAEPGQLVYLEQPEIHLHPRAQIRLATVLADAARRGVRVVAETHSALLLLAVQTLVAEGEFPAEDVALHWFSRRPSDGVTEVTSANLDGTGAFGDWPEDFSDVELTASSRYLDSVDRQLGLL